MTQKTRLDPLVRIRERSERSALERLAAARAAVRSAAQQLELLRAGALAPRPPRADAGLWAVEELAHARALDEVREGERKVATALAGEQAARTGYVAAHRGAEVARRARERKCAEIAEAEVRAERKGQDELAALGFNARR